jgi:hypothetical protein
MKESHRISIAVALFAVLGGGVAISTAVAQKLSDLTPAEEARGSVANVRGFLAPYQNEAEMSHFVGAQPKRCEDVGLDRSICVWSLSKRESGWRPLAGVLYTRDRLNLVCEFAADDAPRAENSCSAHAQRSNRRYYRSQLNAGSSGGRAPSYLKARTRASLESQAQKLIANSKTAFALSTLVGDAPVECRSTANRVYCTWKTNAGTYGHGTLAMSIGASLRKKVRMGCMLPADGSPRAPDACSVTIGG